MNKLRKKLDQLPVPETKDKFDLQKNLIEEKLRKELNHSIKHSKYCKCKFPTFEMCFSFALGIPESIIKKNIFNYKPFIKFLIDEKVLIPNKSGKLIFYGKYPLFEHAGIKKGKRVISKWGLGHIWEHDINDVPKKYGNYAFYDLPSKNLIIKKLKEYSSNIKIK